MLDAFFEGNSLGSLESLKGGRLNVLHLKTGKETAEVQGLFSQGRIWQHECDGWYVYSNISNGTKKEDLQRISDYYHLGLKIEEGKPK